MRNFVCLLMLANGTPMFCAGDEFLATQNGNNNPYNQDNEINYLDWDLFHGNHDIFRFFQRMIAFRKAHPSIARSHYWREDIHWYGTGAHVDFSPQGQTLAYCLHGASVNDTDIYAMVNGSPHETKFRIQEGKAREWLLVADTSLAPPDDIAEPGREKSIRTLNYVLGPRSVAILVRRC